MLKPIVLFGAYWRRNTKRAEWWARWINTEKEAKEDENKKNKISWWCCIILPGHIYAATIQYDGCTHFFFWAHLNNTVNNSESIFSIPLNNFMRSTHHTIAWWLHWVGFFFLLRDGRRTTFVIKLKNYKHFIPIVCSLSISFSFSRHV